MPTHVARTRAPIGESSDLEIVRDPDRLAAHLEDAAHVPGGHASGLAVPLHEADVAALLRNSRAVLPIGAQSSLTGGATPMGDLLLSTAHMTAITCDADTVTAQPGVTLADLDAALAPTGRWYPPAPTYPGATMGGVVSTNAAGAATFKYGTTRSWVEALTVVLAGGDVLDLRRGEVLASPGGRFEIELRDRTVEVAIPSYRMPDVPKVSAGYYASPRMDLVDLFIGAEGTLGVVTSVTVRSCPRPATALALVSCPSRQAGLDLVARFRNASMRTWSERDDRGIDVAAIEHMDRRSLELARSDDVNRAGDATMLADAEMALLVTLELPATDSRRAFDEIGRALDADAPDTPVVRFCRVLAGARLLEHTEMALPDDRRRQAQFLALREAVPSAVNHRIGRAQHDVDGRIEKVAADVIVPFDRLAALMDRCEEELRCRRLDGAVWGHISDGNLHPNVMPRTVEELAAGRDAVLAIGRAAIAMGGAPLAEHGVGRNPVKQQLMRDLYGEEGVESMRRIKRALDPGRTLAPGVLGL